MYILIQCTVPHVQYTVYVQCTVRTVSCTVRTVNLGAVTSAPYGTVLTVHVHLNDAPVAPQHLLS